MEPDIVSAIHKGYFQQVRFLVDLGQDVNKRDCEGRTPLIALGLVDDAQWAVGMARLLIEKGARINFREKRGLNALHYACVYERIALVEVYLSALDYDINQGDRWGNTALHYAVASGNEAVTKLLLSTLTRYKISMDRPNKRGMTSLMLAWKSGQVKCAHLIKQLVQPDDDCRDAVHFKTATQWEEEAMDKLEVARKQQERSSSRNSYRQSFFRPSSVTSRRSPNPNTSTSDSSMSLSSSTDCHRKPLPVRVNRPKTAFVRAGRATSAPLLSKRQRTSPGSFRQESTDSNSECWEDDDVMRRQQLCKKTINNASNDLRNKPEYVFHFSPMDYFDMGKMKGPISNQQIDYLQEKENKPVQNWRAEVLNMYNAFEFQFTNSFRKAATPPTCDNLLCPTSPIPSDSESEDITTELTSSVSLKKISRRASLAKSALEKLGPDKQRKTSSNKGQQFRKTAQLTSNTLKTFLSSIDSSSSESVNSSRLKTRKTSSVSNECLDDASEISYISHTKMERGPVRRGTISDSHGSRSTHQGSGNSAAKDRKSSRKTKE